MNNTRAPLILEGQVYYDEGKNAYLVVTKKQGETITYVGQAAPGLLSFRGMLEDERFIERFQPVDPSDLTVLEKEELLGFCRPNTTLKTGFIKED